MANARLQPQPHDHPHATGALDRRGDGEGPSRIVVESRANELGLEVALATGPHGVDVLRAYRCGEVVASRLVERYEGRAIGGCIGYDNSLDHQERGAVRLALDEGVRVLRDGVGRAA